MQTELWSQNDGHFVGMTLTYCVELTVEDLFRYSNKIESTNLYDILPLIINLPIKRI